MFLPFSIVFDNVLGNCYKCSKEIVPPLCPHAINSSCVKALQLRIDNREFNFVPESPCGSNNRSMDPLLSARAYLKGKCGGK